MTMGLRSPLSGLVSIGTCRVAHRCGEVTRNSHYSDQMLKIGGSIIDSTNPERTTVVPVSRKTGAAECYNRYAQDLASTRIR